MRQVLLFVSVMCLSLVVVSSGSVQTGSQGSIEGTAVDSTGAAVSGVTVTVTRQGGRTSSTTTNAEGFFRIPNLEPGNYTVTVEAGKGFAKFEQANVPVNLSRSTNVDIQLRPASVAETVEVTAGSGAVTIGSSNAPASITGSEVTELPLNARDYASLALLSPSVTAVTNPGNVTTSGGAWTVTFDTKTGIIRLTLPDDMRAGDTISGTLVEEPKGSADPKRPEIKPQDVTFKLPSNSSGLSIGLLDANTRTQVSSANVVLSPNAFGGSTPAGSSFTIPPLGQQGRFLEIPGPFDGNASNTTLRYGPRLGTLKDFEKGTENVTGEFGLIKPLAESPRGIVFQAPDNLSGPVQLFVSDGGKSAIGPYNNVGVRLSAPKLNLTRGERTTLTVEVSGLEGIKKDVPLQLDAIGVITMDGDNFQNLSIKPNEVQRDGRYTTTRGITGQQAGGFTVTATVIVRRFDFTLQDDADPNRIFHFNSFTGDYVFACGGGSCRPGGSTDGTQPGGTPGKPGGTVQPGGTPTGGTGPPPVVPPTGLNLTGIGKPAMKGCLITLSHNAPDRRIFARLDVCTKSGEASLETKSPKANFNITDKNTSDNPTSPPPPK